MIPKKAVLRVGRLTDNLDDIAKMYQEGLGFQLLGGFDETGDFSGRMLGHPDHPWHLVFTSHESEKAGKAPTQENFLVFYIPDKDEYENAIDRMNKSAFKHVDPFNPYWEDVAMTYEDLDGYRVIIANEESPF